MLHLLVLTQADEAEIVTTTCVGVYFNGHVSVKLIIIRNDCMPERCINGHSFRSQQLQHGFMYCSTALLLLTDHEQLATAVP